VWFDASWSYPFPKVPWTMKLANFLWILTMNIPNGLVSWQMYTVGLWRRESQMATVLAKPVLLRMSWVMLRCRDQILCEVLAMEPALVFLERLGMAMFASKQLGNREANWVRRRVSSVCKRTSVVLLMWRQSKERLKSSRAQPINNTNQINNHPKQNHACYPLIMEWFGQLNCCPKCKENQFYECLDFQAQ